MRKSYEQAVAEQTREAFDKLKWQVRDTCARAERAEFLLALALEAARRQREW